MQESRLIDGSAMAKAVRIALKKKIEAMVAGGRRPPGLAVVLVGEDPASVVYVNSKEKDCQKVGIHSRVFRLPDNTPVDELMGLIARLNADPLIDGILVQFPLPAGYSEQAVIAALDPDKDVDGLHVVNAGMLLTGAGDPLIPCTPRGVMEMLRATGVPLAGKHAVVVGRSNLVGKPVSLLLQRENATVTMCHSRTQDLAGLLRQADVVVAAVGRPRMITGDMIKPGALVIDVGINRTAEGLVGDVDFESVRHVAGWLTPVPGGVGPMTRAMLLMNTMQAYERHG